MWCFLWNYYWKCIKQKVKKGRRTKRKNRIKELFVIDEKFWKIKSILTKDSTLWYKKFSEWNRWRRVSTWSGINHRELLYGGRQYWWRGEWTSEGEQKWVCKPERTLRYQMEHMLVCIEWVCEIPSRVAPQEFNSCPCNGIVVGMRVFFRCVIVPG